MNAPKICGVALVLLTALVAPAVAQPAPEGRAAILSKLSDCRKITENAQRLACFDSAVGALEQAEAKGEIVVVDREQARKVRRQAFGFNLPSLDLFDRGESPAEIANVSGKIATARQTGAGKWVVTLEGGAVWEQSDTAALNRPARPGMAVSIKRAALGSFLLSVDGQRSYRARRVQ